MAELATVEQGSTEIPALGWVKLVTHNLLMPGTADTKQCYRKIGAEGRESLGLQMHSNEQLCDLRLSLSDGQVSIKGNIILMQSSFFPERLLLAFNTVMCLLGSELQ